MTQWTNKLAQSQKLLIGASLALLLAACGGTPPAAPAPPTAGFGTGTTGTCVIATGAAQLNPAGTPYSANLIDRSYGGQTASISATLYYQAAFNGGATYQNIVGSSQLLIPQLASAIPNTSGTTGSVTYCASTTDPSSGTVTPGRWANSAVQVIERGTVPVSTSPYSSYPGSYGMYGGYGGTTGNTMTDTMEVRIGYSCDSWLDNSRLNGCVDITFRYLGVSLSLYAQ